MKEPTEIIIFITTADEQEALLNHAYDTWHFNDLIAELASHFGVTLHNYEPKLKKLPL